MMLDIANDMEDAVRGSIPLVSTIKINNFGQVRNMLVNSSQFKYRMVFVRKQSGPGAACSHL